MVDAARAAANQHALPRFQLAVAEQALPGGEPGERHRGRGDEIERARLGRGFAVLDDRIFGIAAALDAQHGENRVALFPVVDQAAASLDDAGNVAPRHIGQLVGFDRGVFAFADLVIDGVHACRHDLHQQFLFAELRAWQILHFQDARAAESVKAQRLHDRSPLQIWPTLFATTGRQPAGFPPRLDARKILLFEQTREMHGVRRQQ